MANRKKKVQIDQDEVYNEIMTNQSVKGNKFKAKTKSQEDYIKLIKECEITICSGPAGTGKSITGIATGLELVLDKTTKYQKLIICTPMVEAEEKIGHLPGSITEKSEPYLASSMSLIEKILSKAERDKLGSQNIIQVEALGFIRGATFSNCILVAEECQNMSPNQMKTLLTRIGENAKFIISGDIEQSDKYKNGKHSGLYDAMTRLRRVNEIGFFEFTASDIVRNKVISKILSCYNEDDMIKELPRDVKKILLENQNKTSDQVIKEGKLMVHELPDDRSVYRKHDDMMDEKKMLPRDLLRKENYFSKIFRW